MKEYNLSDTSDSATAIIAYTIRAMNNCGFSKMQVDRYIKMIKSLSYNELVNLSNSILSSCNDYIKNLYNDLDEEGNMNKKLEARIARLEKKLLKENRFKADEIKEALEKANEALIFLQNASSDFDKNVGSKCYKLIGHMLDELLQVGFLYNMEGWEDFDPDEYDD